VFIEITDSVELIDKLPSVSSDPHESYTMNRKHKYEKPMVVYRFHTNIIIA